jgi:hypothetical protein
MEAIGFDIKWSNRTMTWDDMAIPMPTRKSLFEQKQQADWVPNQDNNNGPNNINLYDEIHEIEQESKILVSETTKMRKILDSKYEKANIAATVQSWTYLTPAYQEAMKKLLLEYESLFDGQLGVWNVPPVTLQLKPSASAHCAQPFQIPLIHRETTQREIERLVSVGVLRRVEDDSEWLAPTFIVPKKDGTVRIVTDFRVLNSMLKRTPYPIPRIQDIFQDLGTFTYASAIDLIMGFYNVPLTPESSRLCRTALPWGVYEYLRLPMGITNSPEIFQARMSQLMRGLESVRVYLDDLLVISNGSYHDHLAKLKIVFERLCTAGLKVNLPKCNLAQQAVEYLGYWLTTSGIKPQTKKVEAILNIGRPRTVKQLRQFIGLVNYYRDMWKRRSHLLAPLTDLLGGGSKLNKHKKIDWDATHEKAFCDIKKVISQEVLLRFPDFTKPFDIHTDASDLQLGAVISQSNHPLAFYSRKLSPTQQRYTTSERELLSIVETLKEFRNILLGRIINVFTDHSNLIKPDTVFQSNRLMRWRLLIEEFSPIFHYIPGHQNVVADALSRLDTNNNQPIDDLSDEAMADAFALDVHADDVPFPLCAQYLATAQRKDKELLSLSKSHPAYFTKTLEGVELIMFKDKVFVPHDLRHQVIAWYHDMLCHPGHQRTLLTIQQHFIWPGMSAQIETYVRSCPECQIYKNQRKSYGFLPAKEAEVLPWHTVCVDLVGPYRVQAMNNVRPLLALTMLDPATGWFEIIEIPDKTSAIVATKFDQTWLCRYPRPQRCICDHGGEFMGKEFTELLESYGIKHVPTTVKNPAANMVERVHLTLGNMLRTCKLEAHTFDEADPWSSFLSKCAWAIRSTVHSTTRATPGQLVFGRDMIFNLSFQVNWALIRERKQNTIRKSNTRENARRISHTYKVNDYVLKERNTIQPKLHRPRDGPFLIKEIFANGTARIARGPTSETVSLRRLVPYYQPVNLGGV